MNGVNKMILIGTLGKDVETRYAASGSAICNFSIATSERWTDKTTGEKKEETEWSDIVVFGKTAEACAEYLSKGKVVYVEGKKKTEKYKDKAGVDKYSVKIIADKIEFLSPREDKPASAPARPAQRANPRPAAARDDFDDESLPF